MPELWKHVPMPAKVTQVHKATIDKILNKHRIRHLVDKAQVLDVLRKKHVSIPAHKN